MSSGLRSRTTNGPPAPAAPRGVAAISSDAFFCAGVSLSAGIGGKRSWATAETANTNNSVVLNSKFMGGVYQVRRANAGGSPRRRRDRLLPNRLLKNLVYQLHAQ